MTLHQHQKTFAVFANLCQKAAKLPAKKECDSRLATYTQQISHISANNQNIQLKKKFILTVYL